MEYQEEYTVSDSLAIAYHKIVVIFVVTYKPLKWLGILYFVLHDVLMLIYNVTIINKLYIYTLITITVHTRAKKKQNTKTPDYIVLKYAFCIIVSSNY